MERADFEEWMRVADKQVADAWQRQGGQVPWDEVEHSDLTAADVVHVDVAGQSVEEIRRTVFLALMEFFWAEGPHPIKVLKRLFHITLNVDPKRLYFMNQTQLARLLNETRAAFCAREKKVWEEFLSSRGFVGTRGPGKKSDEARATYRRLRRGNTCRLGGKKRARRVTGTGEPAVE